MADFEFDTRVYEKNGTFSAVLDEDWKIWGPNGGYLCTFALRAAGVKARIQRPVAFYAHYLRSPRFDEVTLTVDTLMQGRRAEAFEVRMLQDDKPVLVAMVRTAAATNGLEHDVERAPGVLPPDECQPLRAFKGDVHRFFDSIDVRVTMPERFAEPQPELPPRFHEWYRFRSADGHADPFVDAARSLVLIDTLCWPAAVMAHPEPEFHAPSLDVGVWFHRSAVDSDWLLVNAQSDIADQGTIGARAQVFDRNGKLVASGGTALLCLPVAPLV